MNKIIGISLTINRENGKSIVPVVVYDTTQNRIRTEAKTYKNYQLAISYQRDVIDKLRYN